MESPLRLSDGPDLPGMDTDSCPPNSEFPAVPMTHQFLALTEPERDSLGGAPSPALVAGTRPPAHHRNPLETAPALATSPRLQKNIALTYTPDDAQQEPVDDRRSGWLQLTTSQILCQPRAEKGDPTSPPSLTTTGPISNTTLQVHKTFELDMNFAKTCEVLHSQQLASLLTANKCMVSHLEAKKFFKVVQVFKEVAQRFLAFCSEHKKLQETIIQKLERAAEKSMEGGVCEKAGASKVIIINPTETIHNLEQYSEVLQKPEANVICLSRETVTQKLTDTVLNIIQGLIIHVGRLEKLERQQERALCERIKRCEIEEFFTRPRDHGVGEYGGIYVSNDCQLQECTGQRYQPARTIDNYWEAGEIMTLRGGSGENLLPPKYYFELTRACITATEDVDTELRCLDSQAGSRIGGKLKVEKLFQDYMLLQEQLATLDKSFQTYRSSNDLFIEEFTRQLPQL